MTKRTVIGIMEDFMIDRDIQSPRGRNRIKLGEDTESPQFRCEKRIEFTSVLKDDSKPRLSIIRRSNAKGQTLMHRPLVADSSLKRSMINLESKPRINKPEFILDRKPSNWINLVNFNNLNNKSSGRLANSRSIIVPIHNKDSILEKEGLPRVNLDSRKKSSTILPSPVDLEKPRSNKPIRSSARHKTEAGTGQSYKENNTFHIFMKRHKDSQNAEMADMIEKLKAAAMVVWSTDSMTDTDCQLQMGFKMGEGAFGAVYEAYDKLLKRSVAVKHVEKAKINNNPRRKELVEMEVRNLAKIPPCSQVCQFYRVFEDNLKVRYNHTDLYSDGVLWVTNFEYVPSTNNI
jgi:Protein kinase domain